MMMRHLVLGICLLSVSFFAHGETEAITSDGRRVWLKDDHTWDFIADSEGSTRGRLVMTVEKKYDITSGCRIGLRLQNNTDYRVTSIVPQFSDYTRDHIRLETIFVPFEGITATFDRYQEMFFRGMKCRDIAYLKIHGGDRCTMGDLDKFSGEKGECLSRVLLIDSEIISIVKSDDSEVLVRDLPVE